MRIALSILWLLCLSVCADAANRFLTCVTACTITAVDTTIWGTTTGGTGASVPGSSDAVILDGATCVGGVTCTATMGAGYNPTWQSITMGACTASTTGCILTFAANNNNITLTAAQGFSGTGTGTRTLNMGGGIWTISSTTAATTVWTFATTTNLTFSGASATLNFTGTSGLTRTFSGGGLAYGNVTFSAQSGGAGSFAVTGTNSFVSLTVNGPHSLVFPVATTTITTLSLNGVLTGQIGFNSATFGSAATLSVASNAPSLTWLGLRDITGAGGATFVGSNCFNLGNVTGITCTIPSSGGGRIIGG